MKYLITIARTSTQHTELTVEAESRVAALHKAYRDVNDPAIVWDAPVVDGYMAQDVRAVEVRRG